MLARATIDFLNIFTLFPSALLNSFNIFSNRFVESLEFYTYIPMLSMNVKNSFTSSTPICVYFISFHYFIALTRTLIQY